MGNKVTWLMDEVCTATVLAVGARMAAAACAAASAICRGHAGTGPVG